MWTQPRGAALGLHRISRSTRAQAAGDPSDGGWRKNPSATPRSPNKKAGKLAPREAVPPRWSSLDTGVTYGDRLTRMTRRQIRVGRHAQRSYQNWVRTRVSPPEVASRETAADDRASPTVAREPPGVRNNVVAPSSPLAPYWTDRSFPPAIESETGTSEAEEDATLVNEFRDAAGAPFTVELSNEDAPPGLTKIELRGMDRANLLGALCSALARLDIAVVSGTISTGPDGRVRNTMHVRREGGAVDEDDFSRVSLQVLAACWNSDRRDWLRTRRPAGKYLTAAAPSPANTTRLQRELALAEARTRAVSARLADAAARLSADAWSDVDESLIREMEDAVRQVTEARARVAAGPRAIEGYPSTIDTLDERSDAASPFSAALAWMGRIGGDAEESSHATNPLEAGLSRASPFVRGVAYMNLASLLFRTNQVVIKQVADAGVDDFTQMFLRFGLAAVPLLPHIAKGASRKGRGEMLKGAAHLGTILADGYFLQIVGLEGTTSAKGALTSTFTVLSVPIFAGLHGQRVPWYTWPASALGMVGVGLLTGGDGAAPTTGDAVCILSAVIFGYHTLQSSAYAQRFEDAELPFISFQIGVVAVEAGLWKLGEIAFRAAEGGTPVLDALAAIPETAASLPWIPLVYMGFVTTSFTLWIEFLALQNVSASMCALIYTAEPLWGAMFAWTIMGDRWGPAGWIGAALIVGASAGSQLLSFRELEVGDAEDAEDTHCALMTENFSKY